ncbi:hypothetical protein VTN02DRAFT_6555 [Thermoascus thermophilus]
MMILQRHSGSLDVTVNNGDEGKRELPVPPDGRSRRVTSEPVALVLAQSVGSSGEDQKRTSPVPPEHERLVVRLPFFPVRVEGGAPLVWRGGDPAWEDRSKSPIQVSQGLANEAGSTAWKSRVRRLYSIPNQAMGKGKKGHAIWDLRENSTRRTLGWNGAQSVVDRLAGAKGAVTRSLERPETPPVGDTGRVKANKPAL